MTTSIKCTNSMPLEKHELTTNHQYYPGCSVVLCCAICTIGNFAVLFADGGQHYASTFSTLLADSYKFCISKTFYDLSEVKMLA